MRDRRAVKGIVLAVVFAMVFGLVFAGHSTWAETSARAQDTTVGVQAFQLGRQIDLYGGAGNASGQVSPYPPPYGGQGPYQPMDMVPANSTLILCANVTFDGSPVQSIDVRFILVDPHGNVLFNDTRLSDQYGVANMTFSMPWPSENAESVIGVWNATATANILGLVNSDFTPFIYDRMVHIWNVRTDKAVYQHLETVLVTVNYGTYSMQAFQIYLKTDLVDASNVTINEVWSNWTIGGTIFGRAQNYSDRLSVFVPDFATNGTGHVYSEVFDKDPSIGGSLLCPVYAPPPAILIGSLPGDIDGNGWVNVLDAIDLSTSFGKSIGQTGFNPNADFDDNGIVNILDAITLANHYNQHFP
jgi:hypothetical protein